MILYSDLQYKFKPNPTLSAIFQREYYNYQLLFGANIELIGVRQERKTEVLLVFHGQIYRAVFRKFCYFLV